MPEHEPPPADPVVVVTRMRGGKPDEDNGAMVCERCGKGEMYRMHAVWRCPECGFKTDCCGW